MYEPVRHVLAEAFSVDQAVAHGIACVDGHIVQGCTQCAGFDIACGCNLVFVLCGKAFEKVLHHEMLGRRHLGVDEAVGSCFERADVDKLNGNADAFE